MPGADEAGELLAESALVRAQPAPLAAADHALHPRNFQVARHRPRRRRPVDRRTPA